MSGKKRKQCFVPKDIQSNALNRINEGISVRQVASDLNVGLSTGAWMEKD